MIEADARALLEMQTQWEVDPALTSAEVDLLLSRARVTDAEGYYVGDAEYTDTWSTASINEATRRGWILKAAKASSQYDVSPEAGTSFKRKQKYDMCMAMSRQFGSGIGTIAIRGSYGGRSL